MNNYYQKFKRINTSAETEGQFLYIGYDEDAEDPRAWDNLWTILTWARHAHYGDSHQYQCPDDFVDEMKEKYGPDCFHDSEEVIILPIIKYEHSGVSLSYRNDIYPYNDRWDAGQIGWAYVTKEKYKEFCQEANDWKKNAIKNLEAELETYNMWLSGDCYYFLIVKEMKCPHCGVISEEQIDSCGGFYGTDWDNNGLFEATTVSSQDWEEIE
jgi:hypothetical protein